MKLHYSFVNIIKGALVFGIGDFIASYFLDSISLCRIIGMTIIGATIYAFEIPNYFEWIELKTNKFNRVKASFSKLFLAVAYFNPVWIFRHLIIVKLLSGEGVSAINYKLLSIAFNSFLYNLPVSIPANYVIQNIIPIKHRFISSAIFSALMAIYYALSIKLFD